MSQVERAEVRGREGAGGGKAGTTLQLIRHCACKQQEAVQEAWQVFDLTPKMSCTKVSLIRNVKMMKTNLLKACVSLPSTLPASLHLPLSLPGQAHLSAASESSVAWEGGGAGLVPCATLFGSPAHMRLMNDAPPPPPSSPFPAPTMLQQQQKATKSGELETSLTSSKNLSANHKILQLRWPCRCACVCVCVH